MNCKVLQVFNRPKGRVLNPTANKCFAIGIVLILLPFCFMILGCDNGSPISSDEYDATRSIVCLGDSLTAGMINYIDRPEKSWPARLQDKVTVQVVNAGISGDTTAGGLARLERDVLSQNPQIVIIALGGNDMRGFNIENSVGILDTIETNLQKIIDRVKGPDRKLYLVNYISAPYLSAAAQFPADAARMVHYMIANVYKLLAVSNNISLIENMITEEMCNYISADGIHLDETGYEMAADIIFDAIKPFLLEHNLVK